MQKSKIPDKESGINQELWRVKDWADDLLVLKLCSGDTAARILSLKGAQDETSQVVTCLALFFNRVHLVAINCKDVISAKQSVEMLWSEFLFCLHIDGVHIITKRNLLMECLPLCFLMYNSNVVQPHLLGTEPSEHSNALLRNTQREFTVKDFILIIKKLWRQWRAVIKGGLRLAKDYGG